MKVTVELDTARLRGCSLTRTFPIVIRNTETNKVVQFANTVEGAQRWIKTHRAEWDGNFKMVGEKK